MRVDIWSDVVCPWCYIGKRRFEQALSRFPAAAQVDVHWHSFELDPTNEGPLPYGEDERYVDRLSAKYGTGREQAQQMLDGMTQTAAGEGLAFDFSIARPSGTFDAHRLLHLAAERGVQDAVKERLMRGYFSEGEAVGDRATLVRLAAEAGLDPDEVATVLEDQRFAGAVRADEAEAATIGVQGVPFFVVDRRYGVSGAQPVDVLVQVLERAWSERSPLISVDSGGAGACGPDGCAI
jgi:predicted DsbA family dithiol-disulfide isomerase